MSVHTPGGQLFAIIAAVIFAIVFILDLAGGKSYNSFINPGTLTALGLLCIALHLAPLGSMRWRR